MKHKLPSRPFWIIANSSASPAKYSVSPGDGGAPSGTCRREQRRSASMIKTRRSGWRTIDCARLLVTKVLPSAGTELVTRRVFNGCVLRIWYKRERKVRNCSAPCAVIAELMNTFTLGSRCQVGWVHFLRRSSKRKYSLEAATGASRRGI